MPGGGAARGYEFRVAICVPEAVAEAFPEPEAVVIGKQTVFYGDVIDEAHLFGLLDRFRVFGLRIVEIRPLPSA
ncbi:hypothetical protein [Streptomyces sp. SP2-10]|uniref:hypothetical protein n=1 Tax=Streptomyces sp. SP2-10 TaxID=2873385 RepID=UPI001CA6075D|nr:hypothetical protein [Streptomyces sp. SP2-10]MBY8846919.1 hypothetical protein [Streptomyces sp. SP2-10]